MSADDLKGIAQLLGNGGNVAIMAVLFIAYKTREEFKTLFRELIDSVVASRTETKNDLEAIKRAVIAREPDKAAFFEKGP